MRVYVRMCLCVCMCACVERKKRSEGWLTSRALTVINRIERLYFLACIFFTALIHSNDPPTPSHLQSTSSTSVSTFKLLRFACFFYKMFDVHRNICFFLIFCFFLSARHSFSVVKNG